MKEIQAIPITKIDEPQTPDRLVIGNEGVQELAKSMQKMGLLQPILVRQKGDRYEVEAGHRRLLAARVLNWAHIDAIIDTTEDEETMHLTRAHENLIREDLNPVEEGKLVHKLVYEDGRGVDETSKMLCKSTNWIQNRMDILRWPEEVRDSLQKGKITLAVAKELARINDKSTRDEYTKAAGDYGASSAVVRQWIEDTEIKNYLEQKEVSAAVGTATASQMGKTQLTCSICGQYHDIERLKHIWVDPDCMGAVLELSTEVRKIIQEGEQ